MGVQILSTQGLRRIILCVKIRVMGSKKSQKPNITSYFPQVSGQVLASIRAEEFEKLFLPHFPYSLQVQVFSGKKRKKKNKEFDDSSSMVSHEINSEIFKAHIYLL